MTTTLVRFHHADCAADCVYSVVAEVARMEHGREVQFTQWTGHYADRVENQPALSGATLAEMERAAIRAANEL